MARLHGIILCLLASFSSSIRNAGVKNGTTLEKRLLAEEAPCRRLSVQDPAHSRESTALPFSALFELGVGDASEAVNRIDRTFDDSSPCVSDVYGSCGYAFALVMMVIVVIAMFHHTGCVVVAQIITYLCCLSFIKISMKTVFALGFQYAKFVTALHLLATSLAAFTVLLHRRSTTGKEPVVPTLAEMLGGIFPIALTFGLSVVSENSALVLVSAAFSEVVASANPVVSAFLTWACGMTFRWQLLGPIGVVVLGCVVSIQGEMYFSSSGLALLFISVFSRGLKAVLQQKLLTGETKDRFEPFTLVAWSSLFSFVVVLVYSLMLEGTQPLTKLIEASQSGHLLPLAPSIALSCVIAVKLNISALFVVKELGAVGMQMVSQMKAILVVIGGVFLLSESFTPMQQGGFLIALAGVWWFSRMKMDLTAKGP